MLFLYVMVFAISFKFSVYTVGNRHIDDKPGNTDKYQYKKHKEIDDTVCRAKIRKVKNHISEGDQQR